MANKHFIDGVIYVEVERKAKVGEKVVAVRYAEDSTGIKAGDILVVDQSDYEDGSITVANWEGFFDIERGDKYLVLEPITDESSTQSSPNITDLLANLARRVNSLEHQLADTQRNLERQAEEIATLKHLAESNEGDITMRDERSQVLNAIQKFYGGARR